MGSTLKTKAEQKNGSGKTEKLDPVEIISIFHISYPNLTADHILEKSSHTEYAF